MRHTRRRLGILAIALVICFSSAVQGAPHCKEETLEACLTREFSGVVIVIRQGQVVLRAAYGESASGVPNELADRYRIGSLSKTFTGAAAHDLASQGRLDLDAPVHDSLPQFPDMTITSRQLLEHTAGLGDFSQADWKRLLLDPPSRADVLAMALAVKRGRPGRFRYSNAGYVILAAVLERVAGEPIESLVQRTILVPLGLAHTGFATLDADIAQLSVGHDARGRPDTTPYHYDGIAAIGGMYSTLDDLLVWARIQTDPSQRSATFVSRPSGWATGERFERRAQWHAGLTNSHAAFVLRFRDEDSLIVALSNRGGEPAKLGPLVKIVAQEFFSDKPPGANQGPSAAGSIKLRQQ
ncbi:MAG: serine hydrolase domain-containing protein [Steroidobacteraceae bacterium]